MNMNITGGQNMRLNRHFRLQRRGPLIQRLKEHFVIGNDTDKVPVTDVRMFLSGFEKNLSKEECGRIIRQAFPGINRQSSNSKWYYYRLKHATNGKTAVGTTREGSLELESEASKSVCRPVFSNLHVQQPDMEKNTQVQEPLQVEQLSSSEEKVSDQAKQSACNDIQQQPDQLLSGGEFVSNAVSKPFKIPCLNLCKEDMSDLDVWQLIGEGTFGQCYAGTYKDVPAAFKVFKHCESVDEVHREANILLKIPSHPGIPMLIGVYTTNTPFILATKLCKTSGYPETFSQFLHRQEHNKGSLSIALTILLSVAETLSHLFSVGIIHNDLKGNNVVIEDSTNKKRGVLIDFGKACFFESAKASVRHTLMSPNERTQYRERYPHVAPELSMGVKPSTSSDMYSFGHMFCLTMKEMKELLGDQGKKLLELGKQMSHFRPNKRPTIAVAVAELARLHASYI